MAREMTPAPDSKGNKESPPKRHRRASASQSLTVRVHYNGYLEYCDKPYYSSRLRNHLMQCKLGQGESV